MFEENESNKSFFDKIYICLKSIKNEHKSRIRTQIVNCELILRTSIIGEREGGRERGRVVERRIETWWTREERDGSLRGHSRFQQLLDCVRADGFLPN